MWAGIRLLLLGVFMRRLGVEWRGFPDNCELMLLLRGASELYLDFLPGFPGAGFSKQRVVVLVVSFAPPDNVNAITHLPDPGPDNPEP